MEKRINNKITGYIKGLKEDYRKKIFDLNFTEESKVIELLEYIYNYHHINIDKNDFQKRKRVKNVVPFCDRCKAKRANNEQCSRRRRDDSEFCGTHIKGIPHGKIDQSNDSDMDKKKKISVWAEEIMGITYYIDENKNVYSPGDIIKNKENPDVIAKWELTDGKYTIPALFNR